jgi:23S rRNA (cytidine1920-2'-O)/16S rRNA (cytidine1409-2'-O)-methyltransferase
VTRRRRLDLELVRRGLVESRSEATDAIATGRVVVAGRPALKGGTLVSADDAVYLVTERRFASRGGEKLAPALKRFGVDPAGKLCLDAGAAAGGFTDVLLSRSAAHVVAVDVGYGQLSWRLREDPRVTVMERTNVRGLRPSDLPYRPQLVVADLSFISLTKVLTALADLTAPGGDLVLLVKPQFEASRPEVGRGGVVRDPAVWRRVLEDVTDACRKADLGTMDVMPSPLPGPAGNVEFLLHARAGDRGRELDLDTALAAAPDGRTG